jgi:cellulose biosynthesis protein BcsQ
MSQEGQRTGAIITFYSYKGGTGRTMALANVACLLARRCAGDKILMVDWDLEAPGLHRYFRDHVGTSVLQPWNRDKATDEHVGLLDLFVEVDRRSRDEDLGSGDNAAKSVQKIYAAIGIERFIMATNIPGLHLMKAGRFDASYTTKVNTFDWAGLFSRSEWLIRMLADQLKQRYRYILIDSRTGITDTSGICTTLLPDKLVVVFTPNRQSLTGIKDLVQSATNYRRGSADVRPLVVFPVAARVEASRPSLRERWRFAKEESDVTGYQPLFEDVLKKVYGLEQCDLQKYFDEVQIQHVADYAYGEEIAVLTERELSQDRFSLTRSFETLTDCLESQSAPWAEVDPKLAEAYASKTPNLVDTFRALESRALLVWRRNQSVITASMFALLLVSTLAATVFWRGARKDAELQATQAAAASNNLAQSENLVKALREAGQVRLAEVQKLADDNRREADKRLEEAKAAGIKLTDAQALAAETQKGLESRIRELQANLDLVQSELDHYKGQLGWKNIIRRSAIKITAATGQSTALQIREDLYLWPVRISLNFVDLEVRSTRPAAAREGTPLNALENKSGIEYLRARLPVGGSTNFNAGQFQYKVTLDDILSSRGKQDSNALDEGAAVFSVDQRESERKPADK